MGGSFTFVSFTLLRTKVVHVTIHLDDGTRVDGLGKL